MEPKTYLRWMIGLSLVILFASGCAGPAVAPTGSAATAIPTLAAATASPTDTPEPPTDTAVPTDTPTSTATATLTQTPTETATETATPTLTPTSTPTRTATRRPTLKPTSTNTLAPVGCNMILMLGGQGLVTVNNNYATALTLSVADKTYTIPGKTAGFRIDVGPGNYVYTAVVPGVSTGTGPFVVMSRANTMLSCGRPG